MKIVCAWCRKTLQDELADDPRVSHGICQDCKDRILGASAKEISEFLRMLEIPVIVLDREDQVIDLNGPAEKILGASLAEVKGATPGLAISCQNAGLPGGCGLSEHCPGCQLRRNLEATHADAQPRFSQITQHDVVRNGMSRTVQIRFSTQKAGDVVLLLLEEVTETRIAS
jgi:hypothetical protein